MVHIPYFPLEEPERFWSTDLSCPSCKGPVDAVLNEVGGWIWSEEDRQLLISRCRSCSKELGVKMELTHHTNQYRA